MPAWVVGAREKAVANNSPAACPDDGEDAAADNHCFCRLDTSNDADLLASRALMATAAAAKALGAYPSKASPTSGSARSVSASSMINSDTLDSTVISAFHEAAARAEYASIVSNRPPSAHSSMHATRVAPVATIADCCFGVRGFPASHMLAAATDASPSSRAAPFDRFAPDPPHGMSAPGSSLCVLRWDAAMTACFQKWSCVREWALPNGRRLDGLWWNWFILLDGGLATRMHTLMRHQGARQPSCHWLRQAPSVAQRLSPKGFQSTPAPGCAELSRPSRQCTRAYAHWQVPHSARGMKRSTPCGSSP